MAGFEDKGLWAKLPNLNSFLLPEYRLLLYNFFKTEILLFGCGNSHDRELISLFNYTTLTGPLASKADLEKQERHCGGKDE